jgi:hypothetical protein
LGRIFPIDINAVEVKLVIDKCNVFHKGLAAARVIHSRREKPKVGMSEHWWDNAVQTKVPATAPPPDTQLNLLAVLMRRIY